MFGEELDRLALGGGAAADRLTNTPIGQHQALIRALLVRIEVSPEVLTLDVRPRRPATPRNLFGRDMWPSEDNSA